jgi:hypothetical protein
MSFFELGRSERKKKLIANLDLKPYVKKAKELFGLEERDVEATVREYRHFLYLVYWNFRLAGDKPIVPTKRADKLWHAHILYTRDYQQMCTEVFERFLHHAPGLEEGTKPFVEATKHTKRLHDHVYKSRERPGFDEDYFDFVEIEAPSSSGSSKSIDVADATDGNVGGSGDTSSCGGGGCGGGCGGG